MTQAPICGAYYCARRTKHVTGRCHHHRHGFYSRTDGVAFDPSGSTIVSAPPAPSAPKFHRRSDGSEIEEWTENGKTSRTDGPAKILRHADGTPSEVSFYRSGELHRVDGPAVTEYRKDGTLSRELYYYRGELHRVDGPTIIVRGLTGVVETEAFHLRERGFQSHEHLLGSLLTRPEKRVATEIRASIYRPVLRDGYGAKAIVGVLREGVRTPEGVREVLDGAPVEWVRSYEEGQT